MVNIEKIAIFGASGMTGTCVLKKALASGFKTIKILLRDPSKLQGEFLGKVEVINGNVMNLDAVENTICDVDAVIVTLGTRNKLDPTTELSKGLENIVKAMRKYNLKVISVCLSAFLFYDPEKIPPVFKHVNEEHQRMLDILKSSGLHYVAVLPPQIADNTESDYIVSYNKSPGGKVISKYELADFFIKSIMTEAYYGQVVGLCSKSALPKLQ